jgi:hypothetical protein
MRAVVMAENLDLYAWIWPLELKLDLLNPLELSSILCVLQPWLCIYHRKIMTFPTWTSFL